MKSCIKRVRWVSDGQEEIYSIMFSSLKHPARRKILRILSDKPLTFSEMLELLGVSSSNLTYHLDNLGELVMKDENGVYKLSTFGMASVNTMRVVEEAPQILPKRRMGLSFKWRTLIGALLIGLIMVATVAAIQGSWLTQTTGERDALHQKYNQLLSWSGTTSSAIEALKDVIQINVDHYQATLLSNTIEQRSDLGGALEQVMTYSLTSSDSKLLVNIWFRNNQFYRYQLSTLEGTTVYSAPQPANALDSAKGILARLADYEDAPYLADMSALLSLVTDPSQNIEINRGNLKLNATVQGGTPQIIVMYSENGVDYSPKSLLLQFNGRDLVKLTDGWYLFTVGSTTVNISADRATTLARNALNSYSWTANGTTVSDFIIGEPSSVVFHPNTKNGLALYPQYTVTFPLDKVYAGGVYSLTVQVWADSGEIARIKTNS